MWQRSVRSSGLQRIRETFERLTGRAIIPYMTAGDPDMESSYRALSWLSEHGADIIEVGVPFSDPMADGPTIQRAMERALRRGTNLPQVLEMVRRFRLSHDTPAVLMGYMNPFFAYGLPALARDAKEAGVDAILAVDLPPEEAREFESLLKKEGIALIFLATPLTDDARILKIQRSAQGFLYFVSVTGITGEREEIGLQIVERITRVKEMSGLPTVLGFGISGRKTIQEFFPYVDGFVVGSAIVRRWEEAGFDPEAEPFKGFFLDIAQACHSPPT